MADSDQNQKAFDPTAHSAPEVVDHLQEASDAEKARIAAEEAAHKDRSTVLKAARPDVPDDDQHRRWDSRGRQMFPWEVEPKVREDADA